MTAKRPILAIDVGGTNVKVLATGHRVRVKIPSGPDMTPAKMVNAVKDATADWKYDLVSIGYPGPVENNRPVLEPHNLGTGWRRFNFERAFGKPMRMINDAAMQALGAYHGGKMLFLGLGTGLGSALIVDGIIEPLELGHLPYRKSTFEEYVSEHALEKRGKSRWRKAVFDVVERLSAAMEPDYVVLGGGGAKLLDELPPNSRRGGNENAFVGAFRLWEPEWTPRPGVGEPS